MSTPRTSPTASTAPAVARLRGWLQGRDLAAFRSVADRHWPGADPLLPRLSRSANHGLLWFGAAAGIAALGSSARSRRAALRGVASLAVASAAINTVGKGAVRRERPIADLVPVVRQLKRQPVTTSFPSGHAASAAAFATGVALESKGWGAVVAPVAVAVAASRVYTGVHYPSDVLAGAALGVGAAFALRGVVPTRGQLPAPGRPPGEAPALPAGKDLVVVVNRESGTATATASLVREALPMATVMEVAPADLPTAFDEAARQGRALGVCGGDGTVNLAASVAATHGLPLAVFPGGTLNHFAYDLGIETVHDTAAALTAGDAIRVDLGRFRPGPQGADGADGYFLNAFSLGVYPDLVRTREHWSPRIGGWPAGVLAAFHVLRGQRPLEAEFQGRRRPLWLVFVGNGLFRRVGPNPGRRHNLADGLLDVRVIHGGRGPALRLLAAAVAGPLTRSPAHAAVRRRRVRIGGLAPGTPYAYDGEVAHSGTELMIDKLPEALTVYCPMPV
ncbi:MULTISPECIES: bifunctional phosphatase PAP2/diacylglycerol kinase family protein [Streptomyces]|uniref:bifunctional phosphatase PAP2/diacylglycerol kinase family protein n=1 Tax=Streptomyces TaxID=1883 RepID=UPI00081D3AA2|nr:MULTISPECIES: bifunctional phosphatase PAP2/diacylglycerol kinase family protein [Streptomyces]OSC68835.1 phosphoesterase [Streptomyces sp. BF-3]UCA51928.1 phosphatase PAP2 family protein [Streptomyces sp. WA6-1-16]GGS45101.1 phosphoesterase [Streptomyces parvus]SCF61307.1 undecaprenyl-diphosphatase [Streptomyces sp. Cmuel-A718b]